MKQTPDQTWSVYIIRAADNSLYTGVTTDVTRRFQEHQANGKKTAKYLKGKHPLSLVFQADIGDKRDAYSAEWHIKQLTKTKKEQLLTGDLALSQILTLH